MCMRVRTRWPAAGFAFLLVLALCVAPLVHGQAQADEMNELADRLNYLKVIGQITLDEVEKLEKGLAADLLLPRRTAVARDATVSSTWMSTALTQAIDAYNKAVDAVRSGDPRVREMGDYWLREASSKANTAERLVTGLLGPDTAYRRPSPELQELFEESKKAGKRFREKTEQMNLYRTLTEVDKLVESSGGKKPDTVLLDAMRAKQERLKATLRRQDESLDKANAARSVFEMKYWLDASEEDHKTVTRLGWEITMGVMEEVAEAKELPRLAEALRGDDPSRKKEAMKVVESLVDLGWEREIIPVLIEMLQEPPPADEQPKAKLKSRSPASVRASWPRWGS